MKTNLSNSLWNAAGGVRYHARAWRYRHLWKPFHAGLQQWLEEWRPDADSLLLIGPSGGYALPKEFVRRFRRIECVDPDPMARLFFQRRHSDQKTEIIWTSKDFFFNGGLEQGRFENFLKSHSSSALLFCNFLGQLPVLTNAQLDIKTDWGNSLTHALEKHGHWASFHDRLSGPPYQKKEPTIFASEGNLSNRDLVSLFFEEAAANPQSSYEVTDHETEFLFSDSLPRLYLTWRLTPHQTHIIECLKKPCHSP